MYLQLVLGLRKPSSDPNGRECKHCVDPTHRTAPEVQFITLMVIKGTRRSHISAATITGYAVTKKQSRRRGPVRLTKSLHEWDPSGQSGLYPSLTDTPS